MSARRVLIAAVLALALCAPSEALSEESHSGLADMRGSLSFGYGKVDDANSYTLEVDFTFKRIFAGVGVFWIDNGNMPGGVRDEPPPPGVGTVYVGKFTDNETGGYLKLGGVYSGFRVFGIIGGSDVTTKYVVRSTLSGINYVAEEETGDFNMLYGGGIGYLMFNRVLLQYQYDNRRKSLFMVGVSF